MKQKSLYIFLTALMGALLFLILHRIIIFIYLYSIASGLIFTDLNYMEFLTIEYFSLIIVLMLGAWYGIWLGLNWFGKVYEEKTHGGFVHHLAAKVFSDNNEKLRQMLEVAKERLEADAKQMGELAQAAAAPNPEIESPAEFVSTQESILEPAKKKRTVRKKPSRKKLI